MAPPTAIVSRRVDVKYGKAYMFLCDDGKEYRTRELAEIIGCTPELLITRYNKFWPDNQKIWMETVQYRKRNRNDLPTLAPGDKRNFCCEIGDSVSTLSEGEYQVAEILYQGHEIYRERAIITVCRVLNNGQVLTRSPRYVGDNWFHV